MVRLVYVILVSLPFVIYYLWKCRYIASHMENYTEEYCYKVAQRMIAIVKKNGRIKTRVFGTDNLPKEGGYVMYPNHQGKYDVLGIIDGHEKPCSFVIDNERSQIPIAKEFTDLLTGIRLDKTDIKNQMRSIMEVISQVKKGRRFILFPEGGYDQNGNQVQSFLPGAFKCSVKSKTPIVPVALIDSYRVFGLNSLKKVTTQVHFLKPIYPEDYQGMNTLEIAEMVQKQIETAVHAVLQGEKEGLI